MSSSSSSTGVVDAILAREQLKLSAQEYAWFVDLYAQLQPQLEVLRSAPVREVDPAVVFDARG